MVAAGKLFPTEILRRSKPLTSSQPPAKDVPPPQGPALDLEVVRVRRFRPEANQANRPLFQTTLQDLDSLIQQKKKGLDAPNTQRIRRSPAAELLSEEEVQVLKERLPKEYHDLMGAFSKRKAQELPPHRTYDHKIVLEKDASLGHCPLYAMSVEKLEKVKEYLDKMLAQKFIKPSTAPYASPILFVEKPGGGLRFCVDYRKLNSLTKKNRYPLPLINETLSRIRSAKYFTKLDIVAAFNKLRMDPGSEDYTTFKTRFGTFKYLVMPFGLCNGPASWQNYMNDLLFEYLDKFCSVYLDDILIYSDTLEEHIEQVRKVLKLLESHGLTVDINKSEFHVHETKYLGFIIGSHGGPLTPRRRKRLPSGLYREMQKRSPPSSVSAISTGDSSRTIRRSPSP